MQSACCEAMPFPRGQHERSSSRELVNAIQGLIMGFVKSVSTCLERDLKD